MSRARRPKLLPDLVEALARRVAAAERLPSKRPEREASSVPFSELRQRVRRFRTSDLLEVVARLALVDEEGHELGTWGSYVAPWALALIARESILYGNDYRHTDVSDKGLAQILNAHGRIQEPGLEPTSRLRDLPSMIDLQLITKLSWNSWLLPCCTELPLGGRSARRR